MNQNCVITIDEEEKIMNVQMKEFPKLLQKSAGNDLCCIFRVPQSLVEINKEAYRPQIVSIGPYHHGNKDLEMIEEHKWRFLNDLIRRTGKPLGIFLNIIVSMEHEIRQSYSESLDHLATNDLAKMMVLDGIFLIEIFRKVGKLIPTDSEDPIFRMVWVAPFLTMDLLRIENQIPFFLLQKLYNASSYTGDPTLARLILEFFDHAFNRPREILEKYEKFEGKHLLDLMRKSFMNTENENRGKETYNPSLKLIQPASKLKHVGIKFKANHEANSFLDIEFRNGILLIPHIDINIIYSSFIMNCVAFEQCYYYSSKDFTTYGIFMACLMGNSMDVGLLSASRIIGNYFGPDEDLAKFFNVAMNNAALDVKNCYLSGLFIEVNNYWNRWNANVDDIKRTYFPSRWAIISVFAAFFLLFLATLQTVYTVYPYYHPN